MIRVKKDTPLTAENIVSCYKYWLTSYTRIKENDDIYTNAANLKLPSGKKIVITSAAATLGDGITISAPDNLADKQKATFDAIQDLYKRQTVINQDKDIITDMIKHGRSYEYRYMTEDIKNPLPKCAEYNALSAFLVCDDTVESNPLFGCYVDSYIKSDNVKHLKFTVIDNSKIYEKEVPVTFLATRKSDLSDLQPSGVLGNLEEIATHPFGNVPFTELLNNKEEQSDFEQVIDLMKDRTVIHEKNFKDIDRIAKNYLKFRNTEFKGDTKEEQDEAQSKAADSQRLGVKTDKRNPDPNDDISILSKNENYTSITEFGKDIDRKIFDYSMVPDLTSDEFSGNITGVALELKLFPFKEMIKLKNGALEKLYRERIRDYMTALVTKESTKYEAFDVDLCTVTFNRSWTTNIIELANLISQLKATGLFSDKYLTNKMPDADYDEEQEQLKVEQDEKAKQTLTNPDPNSTTPTWFNAAMGGLNAAGGNNGGEN